MFLNVGWPTSTRAPGAFYGAAGQFKCTQRVSIDLKHIDSKKSDEVMTVERYVMPKFPHLKTPSNSPEILEDPHIRKLFLSDPELRDQIDMVIGNFDRRRCVIGGTIEHHPLSLGLTDTKFGWVVAATLYPEAEAQAMPICPEHEKLDSSLERLWEMDSSPEVSTLKPVEQQAVDHFETTHDIASDGRFVVKLPRLEVATTWSIQTDCYFSVRC